VPATRRAARPLPAPRYFRDRDDLRRWLARHHAARAVLLVGFHRRATGSGRLTWPQAVQEALCFGWIDGVRRRVDATRYCVRFGPRRAGSIWSAVNVRTARALLAAGRMHAAGRAAYAARRARRTGRYSYEQRPRELTQPYAAMLSAVPAAERFFAAQTPSYRRAATWWVISARQEATRFRRAAALVGCSRAGELIPQFRRRP